MTENGGGTEDRPGWQGFPGNAEPPAPEGPGTAAYDPPVAPQFPVVPAEDLTAPIPVIDGGTTPPPPAGGRRSHRAADDDDPGGWRRYAVVAGVAGALIVVGAVIFTSCSGTSSGGGGVVTPVGPTSVAPSVTPSVTQSVTTPTPTASGTGTASSPADQGESSPSASSSSSSSAAAAAVKQPVLVLNDTAITGLASRYAATVRSKGWTVIKTDNWKGAPVTETTIYYRPGAKNKASAKLFKSQFDTVVAVKPALPGMNDNLTLVLARDAA